VTLQGVYDRSKTAPKLKSIKFDKSKKMVCKGGKETDKDEDDVADAAPGIPADEKLLPQSPEVDETEEGEEMDEKEEKVEEEEEEEKEDKPEKPVKEEKKPVKKPIAVQGGNKGVYVKWPKRVSLTRNLISSPD
jgi:hypothetical protein